MARRNWIVSVDTATEDPLIFGPYTEARAEELAAKFNAKAEASEKVVEEYEFLHASALPIRNPGIRGMVAEFEL